MTDYLADVRKYDANADEAVVAKIVKHLGIALRDRALLSGVRLRQVGTRPRRAKLVRQEVGVTGEAAEKPVASVAVARKADHSKSRVTFYYLVAKELGKLGELYGSFPWIDDRLRRFRLGSDVAWL